MEAVEKEALLALTLTPGFGPTLIGRAVERFGSAAGVLGVGASRLAELERVGQKTAEGLRRGLDETLKGEGIERDRQLRERQAVELVALGEAAYPRLLRMIPDPPRLLWVKGDLREDDALALGVVGSRRCTQYGREQADRLASQCAEAGLCIVSGGAYGIDTAAHRGAMRVHGRTVAVLGSGLAKPYPKDNVDLFKGIVGGHGAVVSELPMDTPPMAEQFPRRNRIISGLALGVLVVEAAKRSGALITARLCVEDHGREAMVVPGRVDSPASEGCHKVLQEGWAKLVTNAADVLDALGEAGQILKAGVEQKQAEQQNGNGAAAAASEGHSGATSGDGSGGGGLLFEANLTEVQRRIVEVLHAPRSLDEVVAWTELPVGQVQADLTLLEIRGTVKRRRGLFVRRSAS